MDTSKNVFQLHGVDAAEKAVLRKKLTRREMVRFFEKLPPTVVAIEACGSSHHWARLLGSLGHDVRLIAPQLAKPYVKRGKNDAADAEALCEAVSRPTMRFVPVKTAEQQAALMLVGVRERLIQKRTQLVNAIRGYGAEFGITAATGACRVVPLLERIAADETIPELARELFALQGKEYAQLQCEIERIDAKLMEWHRNDECSQRLAKIPAWAYRRDLAHDENARSASIQIRSGFCGMDGPDPKITRPPARQDTALSLALVMSF
jgi:transposase